MFSFMKDDVMNTVLGTDTWWWWVSCSVMSDSCDPMDCSLPGLSMGFSRRQYRSELPFLSPEDLPDPGIKPSSPALQAGRFFTD